MCVRSKIRGVICKLDIEKAYDHINWGALILLIKEDAFGNNICSPLYGNKTFLYCYSFGKNNGIINWPWITFGKKKFKKLNNLLEVPYLYTCTLKSKISWNSNSYTKEIKYKLQNNQKPIVWWDELIAKLVISYLQDQLNLSIF